MEYIIETLIYLLAILGIIFTSISFYEMFDLNRYINNTYRIFSKDDDENNKIEIIVKISGLNELEEENLVKKIKGDNNLKELANKIIIEKEN